MKKAAEICQRQIAEMDASGLPDAVQVAVCRGVTDIMVALMKGAIRIGVSGPKEQADEGGRLFVAYVTELLGAVAIESRDAAPAKFTARAS